jgi:6-pyruvoyltetrahydropterin/6-carboxytetrahydropterin synthase
MIKESSSQNRAITHADARIGSANVVPTIECVRMVKFDAGHRVVNHESKCRTLHGHEYRAEIFARAAELGHQLDHQLDHLGRVIDFSVIKSKVGGWIEENWDHNMIVWSQDPNLALLNQCEGAKRPFVTDFNTTAENLATYLLKKSNEILHSDGVVVTKIKLWETQNCYVEVSL